MRHTHMCIGLALVLSLLNPEGTVSRGACPGPIPSITGTGQSTRSELCVSATECSDSAQLGSCVGARLNADSQARGVCSPRDSCGQGKSCQPVTPTVRANCTYTCANISTNPAISQCDATYKETGYDCTCLNVPQSPAVSTVGAVVLSLLLVVSATAIIRRRLKTTG
jgi:hypothetical protein